MGWFKAPLQLRCDSLETAWDTTRLQRCLHQKTGWDCEGPDARSAKAVTCAGQLQQAIRSIRINTNRIFGQQEVAEQFFNQHAKQRGQNKECHELRETCQDLRLTPRITSVSKCPGLPKQPSRPLTHHSESRSRSKRCDF